jgi:hypothetical protein
MFTKKLKSSLLISWPIALKTGNSHSLLLSLSANLAYVFGMFKKIFQPCFGKSLKLWFSFYNFEVIGLFKMFIVLKKSIFKVVYLFTKYAIIIPK